MVTLLCVAMGSGCTSLTGDTAKGKKKESPWPWMKKKEYQLPQTINVTWTYDIYTADGKPPTRGFGGRLYFYNEKSQAIPVEGELTIHGFDDTHRSHDSLAVETADKRFRFTPEQFTTHFSESQLGASYSVWIPWDAAPGYKKRIMLVPTFKTKDGRVIRGNAATVLLPGPTSEEEPLVIQASATKPLGAKKSVSPETTQPQPKTTTIPIPGRRFYAPPRFSPEQAATYIEQANRGELPSAVTDAMAKISDEGYKTHFEEAVQATGNLVPAAGLGTTPQSTTPSLASEPISKIQSQAFPANSVGTPAGFSMPNGLTPKPIQSGGGTPSANSLSPGLAQGLISVPAVHSSLNPLQVPASLSVPSSSFPSR